MLVSMAKKRGIYAAAASQNYETKVLMWTRTVLSQKRKRDATSEPEEKDEAIES